MEVRNEISLRIDKIGEIFQHTNAISTGIGDLQVLVAHLDSIGNEFRSVAYEAAAMTLALKDISNGGALQNWRAFVEGPGSAHSPQIHVGLGWAGAQKRVRFLPLIEGLDPIMRFRVLDGYGYYDGTFRQRNTIMSHSIPEEMESQFLPGYDQGVGRSVWYISKGEIEKASAIIESFPSYRHEDLWRGIGIACVYVGGFDENLLGELISLSSGCYVQLPVSAALVSRTRGRANALTAYTELACRRWCNCTAVDAIRATEKAERSIPAQTTNPYTTWLSNIQEELEAFQ